MKTVSSLVASGSTCGLSAIGLALARPDETPPPTTTTTTTTAAAAASASDPGMTAIATAFPAAVASPFTFTPTHPERFAGAGNNGRPHTHAGGQHAAPQQRGSGGQQTISWDHNGGVERSLRPGNERSVQRSSWLRKLSSSMPVSRDSSSGTPTSRPGSSAYNNNTNGSLLFFSSASGSSTPMLPETASSPLPLPPNKLVKRTASLRSSNGDLSNSASKLPRPTFRRPATSHERAASLHQPFSSSGRSSRMSIDGTTPHARDAWKHYFTPRVAAGELSLTKRRGSSSIPNPIRRVYPDRKYTPSLVLVKDLMKPASIELDDGSSAVDVVATVQPAESAASSPFPSHIPHFQDGTASRRSFSIGDLLSTGPQPPWQRPLSSRGKPRPSKNTWKNRSRVASAPQQSMGNSLGGASGHESERPAKRRELADHHVHPHSICSPLTNDNAASPPDSRQEIALDLGAESPCLQYIADHSLFVEPSTTAQPATPVEQRRLPSVSSKASPSFLPRSSVGRSGPTSTIDSDGEYRSVGDNSTDYQSDNAYDSMETRTTRSSFGRRGPHIETIFDESPPTYSSGRSTKLRDFLSDGQYAAATEHGGRYRHSTIEEEDSVVSTPVRSVRTKSIASTPVARADASQPFSSSPPVMNVMPDPDDMDWEGTNDMAADTPDFAARTGDADPPRNGSLAGRTPSLRFGPSLRPGNSASASTPQRNSISPMDKANLFDWAEQQPSPLQSRNTPPRPRTVHGKKDQDRGSRPSGRRPVSGMHVRSQSVPVVPDLDATRSSVVANKFGTWGVGSKAVTESWEEDFDFDEPSLSTSTPNAKDHDDRRIDSGHELFTVPKSIREQQENVVANIGLLREWGLLIEELKDLRVRAVALGMLTGPHAQAWREVDAMIELADQETEEHTLEPRRSPPSSPGFDYTAFDEASSLPASNRQSWITSAKVSQYERADRDESFAETKQPRTPPSNGVVSRPRKDSELVAQHVIAALQSKRSVSDSNTGPKKVPFDTATLRHIVPYVNSLKRKVKDALRETEGLYSSPHRHASPETLKRRRMHDEEPPFHGMFADRPNDRNEDLTTPRRGLRRERAATDNDGSSPHYDQAGSLTTRIQKLSV